MEMPKQILVVEDETVMTKYIGEILACFEEKLTIRPAATLHEGLELLRQGDFDAVLLDLNLPDSMGLETLRQVVIAAPNAAVVVLTGMDDAEMGIQAIQAGAQDYLIKGRLPADKLFLSLRHALEQRKNKETIRRQQEEMERTFHELEMAHHRLKESHLQILQQEKMASIGQLAAGVAHEINNPIGFISSNLNTLLRYLEKTKTFMDLLEKDAALAVQKRKEMKLDFLLEDAQSLIKESLEGTERIRSIVLDLRNFSRTDKCELSLANVNTILESTLNIVWNELKYKASVAKKFGELPMLLCYPRQLSQVFMNLLINAVQSIEKQGEITITTWHENNTVLISIGDTGCGIPADKQQRIFEPFFTTKDVGKGTGLGLSIVYDVVVNMHHGEIKVESEVGKGTVFTIRLPVLETEGG